MKESESRLAQEAMIAAVENQLADNNPPITGETYRRLASEGYSHDETLKLLGCVLAVEVYEVMEHNQPFDEARYTQNLNNLPDLPWDE